jgi:DNA repair exonuclease SbcCD ATPase subunit
MKIRALCVENFRKFIEPVSLTGLEDGVNVLAECNEFGKSTLLAAIRGVLFERYSSKAQPVQAMRHWVNKTPPTVTLEFEIDGQIYRIQKRFLDKPYAMLMLPDGAKHADDAAEEYLQNLLHFTRAGKTGSKPEDIGMWAALWVTQRDSMDQPKLHDAARRTIHECLDREVGTLAGGTSGSALLNAVRSEIAALRNGLGKPVGRHKDALADLEKSSSRVEELERKQGDLTQDIEELASVERAIAHAMSSGEDARMEADLAEAKQKKEAAQRYEDQEQRAKADCELAQSRLSGLENTAAERANLRRQMEEAGRKVEPALWTAAEATKSREVAANALTSQNERVRSAEAARDATDQKVRDARMLADLARQSESLELLRSRLADAETAQQSVNTLSARLLASPITEEKVKAIEVPAYQVRSSILFTPCQSPSAR